MPTLMAGLLASVLAWVVEDFLQPFLGLPLAALVSLLVFGAVFFPLRNWLRELRGS